MTFKIENNIATLEPNIRRPDVKFDNYEIKIIIKRLDGKQITARNAEIVLASAMPLINPQKLLFGEAGELTE